ncbi:manganese efflux pump [Mycoplasmatota bacterium]|nr:manganese efflux pump [Mycoplasmatota bacterium]
MIEEFIIIIMLSVALAMDAFAISITLGMSGLAKKFSQRFMIGITFGFFQAGLFLLGYFALFIFGKEMSSYNSIVSGILLAFLGLKMLKDSFSKNKDTCGYENCYQCKKNKCLKTGEYRFLTLKILLIYGTATSIDAFAAGISYGLLNNNIWGASISIGVITFIFSFIGAASGMHLKKIIGNKATILGGLILIILAFKSIMCL